MTGIVLHRPKALASPLLRRSATCLGLLLFCWLLSNCSDSGKNEHTAPDGRSAPEKSFDLVAARYNIPARFLLASGYLESGLIPHSSDSAGITGPTSQQSAFGLSRQDLGLSDGAGGDQLSRQIEAYGAWLARQLPEGLKTPPETDEEKYQWAWAMAEAHRHDDSTRALYAIELITTINKGFTWIDPETKRIIPFEPESPALRTDNLSVVASNHLQLSSLTTASPDKVYSARFLRLHNQGNHHQTQNPVRIKITHCPLAFSACIEGQRWDGITNKRPWSGAHYFIPPSSSITDMPLQIAPHSEAVPVSTDQGKTKFSDNEIIIALTGLSGKVRDGVRNPANPLWLTEFQLQNLRALTDYVCDRLAYHNPNLTRATCLQTGSGIVFDHRKEGERWSWGQIPDFSPVIFNSYIGSDQSLSGKTIFELPDNQKIYKDGEKVSIRLAFGLRARSLELEQLIRCPGSKRVHWSVISREQINAQSSFLFEKSLFGSGPNENGSHYFRAKVFDSENKLLGWGQTTVFLTDYEPGPGPVFPGDCLGLED